MTRFLEGPPNPDAGAGVRAGCLRSRAHFRDEADTSARRLVKKLARYPRIDEGPDEASQADSHGEYRRVARLARIDQIIPGRERAPDGRANQHAVGEWVLRSDF